MRIFYFKENYTLFEAIVIKINFFLIFIKSVYYKVEFLNKFKQVLIIRRTSLSGMS